MADVPLPPEFASLPVPGGELITRVAGGQVRLAAAPADRRWAPIERFATTPTKPATGYDHRVIVVDCLHFDARRRQKRVSRAAALRAAHESAAT
jgi:hypothetical protein